LTWRTAQARTQLNRGNGAVRYTGCYREIRFNALIVSRQDTPQRRFFPVCPMMNTRETPGFIHHRQTPRPVPPHFHQRVLDIIGGSAQKDFAWLRNIVNPEIPLRAAIQHPPDRDVDHRDRATVVAPHQ
jgi:hypothetical protein